MITLILTVVFGGMIIGALISWRRGVRPSCGVNPRHTQARKQQRVLTCNAACRAASGRHFFAYISAAGTAALLFGCTISNHGVFPKPVWYWSADAKEQRRENQAEKEARKAYQESLTNAPPAR